MVTRADLGPSYQLPQVVHGVVQFANEFPEEQKAWFHGSNTVVVLAVPDLLALECFLGLVQGMNLKHSVFREPDINNEITSVVLAPCKQAKKVCAGMKLAGR